MPKWYYVGLHSVATYHKKFSWQNKKNKKYFAECHTMALGKNPKDTLCRVLVSGTRQRGL
jgi:hypothetical protein